MSTRLQHHQLLVIALAALFVAACTATPTPEPQVRLASGNETETQAVLELLLSSHQNWFSLVAQGEIKLPDGRGDTLLEQSVDFRLGNPAQARVEIFNKEGSLERTWIANGVDIYDYDPVSAESTQRSLPDLTTGLLAIPRTIEGISGLHGHPMAGLIPTELAALIYPAELAQQAGEYELAGQESIDERPAWQLDYQNLLPGEEYRSARFWVDQAIGIVLLAQYFDASGDLVIEYWIHILELDGTIFEDYFRPWF